MWCRKSEKVQNLRQLQMRMEDIRSLQMTQMLNSSTDPGLDAPIGLRLPQAKLISIDLVANYTTLARYNTPGRSMDVLADKTTVQSETRGARVDCTLASNTSTVPSRGSRKLPHRIPQFANIDSTQTQTQTQILRCSLGQHEHRH